MNIKINLPPKVEYIISTLKINGYDAYIVGGCVRDSIMGQEPKDWDITTNAKPEEIKKFFKLTIDTGIKHGTVTVVLDREMFEVTTYRVDGEYLDGRHPKSVEFTNNLALDLERRDFTINAMAYSPDTGVIDLFGGHKDILRGKIKAVGNPLDRFNEDALRILRAIRFSARFNYLIEEDTYMAMKKLSSNLRLISYERIRDEVLKTLKTNHPEKLELIRDIGANDILFNLNFKHDINYEKIKHYNDDSIKIASLLEATDVNIRPFLRMCKSSNNTIFEVEALLNNRNVKVKNKKEIKYLLARYGYKLVAKIMEYNSYMSNDDSFRNYLNEIMINNEPYDRLHLKVTGKDILDIGVEPKNIGNILNYLLNIVIDSPKKNIRNYLLREAKEYSNIIDKNSNT